MNLDPIKSSLVLLRAKGNHLTRLCFFTRDGKCLKEEYGTYCTAPYKGDKNFCDPNVLTGLVYNGQEKANSSAPTGMLKGGEMSLAWLKFMLDKEISPWKAIHPFILNIDDVEWINSCGGIILHNTHLIPGNLLGSFWIAMRTAQEHHAKGSVWWELVRQGIDPRVATVYAWSANLNGYPQHNIGHTFMSQSGKLWAKQFCNIEPMPSKPLSEGGYITGGNDYFAEVNQLRYEDRVKAVFKCEGKGSDPIIREILEFMGWGVTKALKAKPEPELLSKPKRKYTKKPVDAKRPLDMPPQFLPAGDLR